MLTTYKAVLRGNQLEWREPVPEQLGVAEPVAVYVTILDESAVAAPQAAQGRAMAAALEKLAMLATSTIPDPLAWERDMRQERDLPGRTDYAD